MRAWTFWGLAAAIGCIIFAQNSFAADAVQATIVANIHYQGQSYFVPVKVAANPQRLTSAQADTTEKQNAYLTRIIYANRASFPLITDGFKHYEDVRLYLDVPFDPGPGAHIHRVKGVSAKRICGRLCCTNEDGKQCCAIIICPN